MDRREFPALDSAGEVGGSMLGTRVAMVAELFDWQYGRNRVLHCAAQKIVSCESSGAPVRERRRQLMSEIRATRTIVVNNPQGLHARPAELFAKVAMQFEAAIEVVKDDQRVNAKSILNILTLAVVAGTELKLEAVGPDAEAALEALVQLVEGDFTTDGTMNQEQSS